MKIQIAENIKKFRVECGYTQSDLAVLLSVSPQAVSRWENGQAFPDIAFLPLLAKYLNVSIDELMGVEDQKNKSLEKELYELKRAITEDESERLQNERRILEVYEELAHTKDVHLIGYFQYLMSVKKDGKRVEDRIEAARQMLRGRLRESNMSERMRLLSAVASYEDEEKLILWEDEYRLPEYMRADIWDELLMSRYIREKNVGKLADQNQKNLYCQIKNAVYYLTDSIPSEMKEREKEFSEPERYKTALDTLSLYSTRADDIFIFDRIIAEVRYAEALLADGQVEECLDVFSTAAEHLSVLYEMPEGHVLCGSVPVLNSVRIVISANDKLEKCVLNMGGYDKDPLFDKIRGEKCFIDYTETLEKFFPRQKSRLWINEKGVDSLDEKWKMLLNSAIKEANKLSDGNVIVLLAANGTVSSILFRNTHSAIEADNAMKLLIDKKKNGEPKVDRLICMWHDGSIDLPSFAFREALVAVESGNLLAKILLNGSNGYAVKTVKATMPKGYGA